MQANLGLDRGVTRRQFLATSGAAVAVDTAAGPVWAAMLPSEAAAPDLEKAGFERKFSVCFMCGANCGLTALTKQVDGGPQQGKHVYLLPNEAHPQRGYCGRGASALYVWNHPLRLKTPLKRVGARGEGKFEPVSWDQALDEIAARLKANVAAHGERSVVLTSHDMTPVQQLTGWALGTPNVINHSSNCLTPGAVARRMTFEAPFEHHRRVDPDYANVKYLLMVGRTLQASMGAAARLAEGKRRGAHVVYVDPRQSDNALADGEWVPIIPGTDAAFVLALVREIIENNLADQTFIARHTNGPLLIKPDGLPLTEADVTGNKDGTLFAVFDGAGQKLSFQGVKRPKGAAAEFVADKSAQPVVDYAGEVKLASGQAVTVKSAFRLLRERVASYTPQYAAEVTGVRAATIVRIAREFATRGGVADDGWYLTRNANDTDTVRAVLILNALVGNIDKQGGLAMSRAAGISFVSQAAGEVTSPMGRFKLEDTRRLDQMAYPESPGSFHTVVDAINTGKPYPISTVFAQATTIVQREANVPRVLEALRKLDLFVVIDILPQEITDFADYVLPANFFLERDETSDVKWTLDAVLHRSDALLSQPKGVDARDDLWIMLEVLRRAFPERAERVGYTAAHASAEGFARYKVQYEARMVESTMRRYSGAEPAVAQRVAREMKTQGFSLLAAKKFDEIPYIQPLATPSGKVELYGLRAVLNAATRRANFDPLPAYRPVSAYKLPQGMDQFYMISGKSMANNSGSGMFALSGRALGDRSIWMHPVSAQALGLKDGDTIEVEGLDTGQKGRAKVQVTRRVRPQVLFTYAFGGGHRARAVDRDKRFAFMTEGVNPNWLSPGRAEPVTGALANNLSVKVRKV